MLKEEEEEPPHPKSYLVKSSKIIFQNHMGPKFRGLFDAKALTPLAFGFVLLNVRQLLQQKNRWKRTRSVFFLAKIRRHSRCKMNYLQDG